VTIPDSKAMAQIPELSIIVAVYNDWAPLAGCLQSLGEQANSPSFEVIVVDDGSDDSAPASIREWSKTLPLHIIQETHAGIAVARNRGVEESKSALLVFTDADCRFEPGCLSALSSAISQFPQHSYFQLHLTGDRSTILGRAEDLRLIAIQDHSLQKDGRIRYLNTSGFAVRRSEMKNGDVGLFDPTALRGEDTLLLANLIQRGQLPFFLTNATVRHSVRLSFAEVLRKDVHGTWLEGPTYEKIASKGLRLRMGGVERVGMLVSMWKTSREHSLGTAAWLVLVARQSLQRIVSTLYRALRFGVDPHTTSKSSSS
jgi:glycosyltransferase involved in cell wall biosynthesis